MTYSDVKFHTPNFNHLNADEMHTYHLVLFTKYRNFIRIFEKHFAYMTCEKKIFIFS